jgi:hypothetical protein
LFGHRASGIGPKVAPRRFVRRVGLSTLISICAVLPLSIGGLGTPPAYAAAGDVSTLAGSGVFGFANGPGTTARFDLPSGVAVDGLGNVYVADTNNNQIRKIDSFGVVSTLAGTGGYGFVDGPGTTARFRHPFGVAVDGLGNVYVADTENFRIRKIDSFGVVSTLGGPGGNPFEVAVDGSGNVFVTETGGRRVSKIDSFGVVSTLAGTGVSGFADGPGTTAQFASMGGL